jgi:hypothetical protein
MVDNRKPFLVADHCPTPKETRQFPWDIFDSATIGIAPSRCSECEAIG